MILWHDRVLTPPSCPKPWILSRQGSCDSSVRVCHEDIPAGQPRPVGVNSVLSPWGLTAGCDETNGADASRGVNVLRFPAEHGALRGGPSPAPFERGRFEAAHDASKSIRRPCRRHVHWMLPDGIAAGRGVASQTALTGIAAPLPIAPGQDPSSSLFFSFSFSFLSLGTRPTSCGRCGRAVERWMDEITPGRPPQKKPCIG